MKNLILIILVTVTLTSCKESFIELSPLNDISSDNFYKTSTDVNTALIGLYDAYQVLYGPNYLSNLSEVRSDNTINYFTTVSGGTYADFDNFSVQPSNSTLNSYWVACYKGIQRANIILNRIPSVAGVDASVSGQTKFIRALFYFDLVRFYGGVPLVVDEITDPTVAFGHTRATADEIYSQIIKDLTEAISELPETISDSNFGMPSKWAAKGILARVYLTKKMYTEAKTQLTDIITSGKYSLVSPFSKVNAYSAKGNSEILFAVIFKSGTNSEGYPYMDVNHDFQNSASPNFMATFAKDPRMNATVDTSKVGIFYSPKYVSTIKASDNTSSQNLMVLRMADVYLMLSEILNETGGQSAQILSYMNLVRKRAGLPDYTATDLPNQAAIRLAIEKERRIEFAFENLRWFDLVRTGRAFDVMSKANTGGSNTTSGSALPYTMNANYLLYPIPQNQIDASGGVLTQNEGY